MQSPTNAEPADTPADDEHVGIAPELARRLRDAAADDLALLARLCDRELDTTELERLRAVPVADWFALAPASNEVIEAQQLLEKALELLPEPLDVATLDALSSDYANAFLLNAYRAPPTESPWLDKDQLERQEPMFEIAAWYRRHGLVASDRQRRSEDHFVLQLRFLSHLLAEQSSPTPEADAARFMDEHLLKWFPRFADKIVRRCETLFYGALLTVTLTRLDGVRELLAVLSGIERPPVGHEPVVATRAKRGNDEEATPYVPGVAPGW